MLSAPPQDASASRLWIVGGVAVVLIALGAWLLLGDGPDARDATPVAVDTAAPVSSDVDNDGRAPVEREAPDTARPPAARAERSPARPSAAAPAASAPSAPSLRVESDVPGAMVFLNRKYLGTTPLVSREVTPGSHQLNVQAEGRDPVVQTIEVGGDGETRVAVQLEGVRLDARVPVVHRHGMGSCDGTLIATPAGLRYQTSHATDGFTLSFSELETFAVDYLEKSLRVKQRGGRTWNFTTRDDNADPLYVFHKDVEAVR